MKLNIVVVKLLSSFLIFNNCSAKETNQALKSFFKGSFKDLCIQPTKYDDQQEILIQGASILLSEKKSSIVQMYQTTETLKNRKANFYFIIYNKNNEPENFHYHNLKIIDQNERKIRVVHKNEILEAKKRKKNWSHLASALCTDLESVNAQNAGTIHYHSQSNASYKSNFNAYSSRGVLNGHSTTYGSITNNGTFYCEALRQKAMRQVNDDANYRSALIETNYSVEEFKVNNFYFDSTTIFPNTTYAANFQIDVPKNIKTDLEYIFFIFKVGKDTHTFCYFCGGEV